MSSSTKPSNTAAQYRDRRLFEMEIGVMQLVQMPARVGPAHRPKLCKDEISLVQFRDNVKGWVQSGPKAYWYQQNKGKHTYQREMLDVFKRALYPYKGATVLDVGSNVGFTTIQLARWGCKVLAIEPSAAIMEMGAHNLVINECNKGVTLINAALAHCTGTVAFREQKDNAGVSGLSFRPRKQLRRSAYIPVDCYKLDDLQLGKLDGIKIDTEGTEWLIVQGGLETIQKYMPVLVIEVLRNMEGRFGWDAPALFKTLQSLGYVAYNKDRVQVHKYEHKRGYSDFIFVPPAKQHMM